MDRAGGDGLAQGGGRRVHGTRCQHALKRHVLKTGPSGQARIRDRLNGADLVAFAVQIEHRPQCAERFERLLGDNHRLITQVVVKRLLNVPFLRAKSGVLAAPSTLHLDTPANRRTIADDNKLVAGSNKALYRRLQIREHPAVDTLIAMISDARSRSEPPPRPEIIYTAIASAFDRERRPKSKLKDDPILWVDSAYHAASDVVVGTHISRVFDGVVPVFRRSDEIARAYIRLGASPEAKDEHWVKLFQRVHDNWDGKPLSSIRISMLKECYRQRGSQGLPNGLDLKKCLVATNGLLYSLNELRVGRLLENDFPALADALAASSSPLGVVDMHDQVRPFFLRLGLQHLSSFAGTGSPIFGAPATPPLWFKPHYYQSIVTMMQRKIFPKALHATALRLRHSFPGFSAANPEALARRLHDIGGLAFYFRDLAGVLVGAVKPRVPVEAAVGEGVVGLVAPRTKLDFQQLVAQALAEVAGAANVAQTRALSTAILPLVLCRTVEDIVVLMERMGVDIREWARPDEPELEFDASSDDELGEEIIRQVMHSLATAGGPEISADSGSDRIVAQSTPPCSSPAPLPDLDSVGLTVTVPSDRTVQSHPSQLVRSGDWMPRNASEVARDREIGLRGEELIYRMEIERLRNAGHPDPETVVIWASPNDPGADHDIRSIDEAGRPRWIEVKSTTGNDGRFDWSRNEFERAMRERHRYELWRVYRATSNAPVAKCFRNPAKLLGEARLHLELGSFRACVENID